MSFIGNNSMGPAPEGYQRYDKWTPQQRKLHEGNFKHVGEGSYLSRLAGGDQSAFDEMEQPALRQFGAMQGNMASRFSGLGGAGSLSSQKSSGFQNSMNQAGSDFASELQSKRLGLRSQAIRDLMGMSNDLLSNNGYDYAENAPEEEGFMSKIMGGLLPAIGTAAGGPIGGMIGAGIGGLFSGGGSGRGGSGGGGMSTPGIAGGQGAPRSGLGYFNGGSDSRGRSMSGGRY